MRHVEVPKIEAPERFFPDPVLLDRPDYTVLDDGFGELRHPVTGRPTRLHPVFVAVLQGLERGERFADIARSLPTFPDQHINEKAAAKLARRFCWRLHELGVVRFQLEPPPEVFNGRYARVKELGRGGLGIAHLCRDMQNGDGLVVVKHPWGVKAPITSGQKAIAREIEVMQDVHHPMVPRYHDHFTDGGLLHLVRDFVDGERLQSQSVRARLADPRERNRLIGQVCEGLHAIHQAGYLFFDPSPDNFFLVGDQVVAADVGGCKPHENGRLRVRGGRGTPGYVAPEMRDKDHPQARWASIQSDIWAVGCLFYLFVVGRRPRRAWFHDDIMASLDGLDVRPEDRHVIDLCTRQDARERPRDLLEVRALLR